jgi:YHS domain-containing protein
VCAQPVDPETAPSTTYKGKTYYFCSAADRLRFIMNPETALKGGGGQ